LFLGQKHRSKVDGEDIGGKVAGAGVIANGSSSDNNLLSLVFSLGKL